MTLLMIHRIVCWEYRFGEKNKGTQRQIQISMETFLLESLRKAVS